MDAVEIMAEVRRVYATCRSYRDTGAVWTNRRPEDDSQERRKTFSTAFVRPDRFRFEFVSMGSWRSIIHADSRRVRARSLIPVSCQKRQTPRVARRGVRRVIQALLRSLALLLSSLLDLILHLAGWRGSLDMAIAAQTGTTSGTAHAVPRLLMPERIAGWDAAATDGLERIEDEDIEGVPHYRLLAGERELGPRRNPRHLRHRALLWIDQSTFMLRRVEDLWRPPDGWYTTCLEYSPEMDVDIPEEELEYERVE